MLPKSTLQRVYCECPGYDLVYVEKSPVKSIIPREYNIFFAIIDTDNPFVFYLVLLVFIIFVALFGWAVHVDATFQKPGISFLEDNYPRHMHAYLVIVYTGRKAGSGTTSNVGIKLEGVLGTSLPHILGNQTLRVSHRKKCYIHDNF